MKQTHYYHELKYYWNQSEMGRREEKPNGGVQTTRGQPYDWGRGAKQTRIKRLQQAMHAEAIYIAIYKYIHYMYMCIDV